MAERSAPRRVRPSSYAFASLVAPMDRSGMASYNREVQSNMETNEQEIVAAYRTSQ